MAMNIKQMYNILHKKTDIHGKNGRQSLEYEIIKKYEDPLESIHKKELQSGLKNNKRKALKRGNYLDDEYAIKKFIPGPGTYQIIAKQTQNSSIKKTKSEKKTYLDEIVRQEKKNKFPGPGKYQVLKKMGSSSVKSLDYQKRIRTQRLDYLDNAQYVGTLTPGVGEYQINRYERSISDQKKPKNIKNPEYWREKHHAESEKVLTKYPDPATYNPQSAAYELFSQKSKLPEFSGFSKFNQRQAKRIKTQTKSTLLGPGKYNIIHQWKKPNKNQRGLLDNISTGIPKRVYY